MSPFSVGVLAMRFRRTRDEAVRRTIAAEYAREVQRLIETGTGLKCLPSRISCLISGCPRHSSRIGARIAALTRSEGVERTTGRSSIQVECDIRFYPARLMNPIHSSMHVSVTLETEDEDRALGIPELKKVASVSKMLHARLEIDLNGAGPPQVAACFGEAWNSRNQVLDVHSLQHQTQPTEGSPCGRRCFLGYCAPDDCTEALPWQATDLFSLTTAMIPRRWSRLLSRFTLLGGPDSTPNTSVAQFTSSMLRGYFSSRTD